MPSLLLHEIQAEQPRERTVRSLQVSFFLMLLVQFLTESALEGLRAYLPIGANVTPGHDPYSNPNLGLAEFQAEPTT